MVLNVLDRLIVERDRRQTRYVAEIEVHVRHETTEFVTSTRDVSSGGLFIFATPSPEVGQQVSLLLHPDDGVSLELEGVIRYRISDVGAGIQLSPILDYNHYEDLIRELEMSSQAWNAIGGFVRSNEASGAIFEQQDLVPIGETKVALHILFERSPVVPLEHVPKTDRPPFPDSRERLVGVSSRPVAIRLHEYDRVRHLYVGVLQDRKYVLLIPPKSPDAPSVLYSVTGNERIVVRSGGQPTYPFYITDDLDRIARDAYEARGRTAGTADLPIIQEEEKTPTDDLPPFPDDELELSKWTRFSESTRPALEQLFELFGAEKRVYNVGDHTREVRLLRDLTLMVRRDGGQKQGTLFDDGKRLCVIFGLKKEDRMTIHPLAEGDEVRFPTV